MSSNDDVSRRRFLKSSALLLGTAAVPWIGGRTAGAASAATAIGGKPQLAQGIQIGDVLGDRAVIWSRADRPARLVVDYDVSSRFDDAVRGPVCPGKHRLHGARRLDRFAGRQRNLRAGHVSGSVQRSRAERRRSRSFPHGADENSLDPLSLERRYRGPGLGNQSGIRRDENLRGDAPNSSRFFHSLRGQHLRRRPDARICDGRRRTSCGITSSLRKCRKWPRPWRVSRPVQIQSAGRQRPPFQRGSAADLAVGRSRSHQQLVRLARTVRRRALHREKYAAAGRARRTRLSRVRADALTSASTRAERVYRHIPYGPLLDVFVLDMRSYRGPQQLQPAARAGAGHRIPRAANRSPG